MNTLSGSTIIERVLIVLFFGIVIFFGISIKNTVGIIYLLLATIIDITIILVIWYGFDLEDCDDYMLIIYLFVASVALLFNLIALMALVF